MEEARLTRGARRGRVVAFVLLLAIIGMGVWARVALRDHVKAAVYERRIRSGVNPGGNIRALALLAPEAAVPVLERHTRDFVWSHVAGSVLYRSFPDSTVARGMREYEDITGRAYFGWRHPYYLRHEPYLPSEVRHRFRSWLARYPVHPGRDDVCFRLAAELERDEPIEALRVLLEGFHSPDGDRRRHISGWFHRVLERFASASDLVGWLDGDCPGEIRGPVAYVAAVKLLRMHRFEEAVRLLDFAIPAVLEAGSRPDWGTVCGAEPLDAGHLRKQLDGARWFSAKARELAAAPDGESRAACLHAMGRRAFHDQGIFRNRFHRLVMHDEGPGPRDGAPERSARLERDHGLDDIGLGVSFRQAAGFFRRIVQEHPEYSRIEDVEYSIPLCLWRLREEGAGWWWPSRLRLDAEIHRGFQAFAERYPRSSMADEALYSAGLSSWEASDRRDTTVLMACMLRIVDEHPGGNIIREHGRTNRWLRAAIARRDLQDAAASGIESARCILRAFAALPRGTSREAGRQ